MAPAAAKGDLTGETRDGFQAGEMDPVPSGRLTLGELPFVMVAGHFVDCPKGM